jgi:hypothetical protein
MLQRSLALTAVLVGVTACGSSSTESAHIRGTVSGLTTQNGRVVAVTSQGKSYWSNLAANGAFDITVPAGTNLRVFFASAPAVGLHPIAGHLVGVGGSRWISPAAGTTQLGLVQPATAPAPAGIATKSEGADTGGDTAEGPENESHDDDGERAELCGGDGATDVELHADSAPASSKDTDDKADKDREDESSHKACGN